MFPNTKRKSNVNTESDRSPAPAAHFSLSFRPPSCGFLVLSTGPNHPFYGVQRPPFTSSFLSDFRSYFSFTFYQRYLPSNDAQRYARSLFELGTYRNQRATKGMYLTTTRMSLSDILGMHVRVFLDSAVCGAMGYGDTCSTQRDDR